MSVRSSWFIVVQLLSRVQLFAIPWIAACQASLFFTIFLSLLRLMFIESVIPSNHLIVCHPFSSCPQFFPASGSCLMSWFFASGGQSIRALASATVLPMNFQGWLSLGLTDLGLTGSRDSQESFQALQFESVNSLALRIMIQLSHPYMTTGKTIALTIPTFVGKAMSLLFKYTVYVCHSFTSKEKFGLYCFSNLLSPIDSQSGWSNNC